MITLYELHWSHYCEKVRLALNYMGLAWRAVDIDAFRKDQLRTQPLPDGLPTHTVPAIRDEATGRFVMDSTPILHYLAAHYPTSPALFPDDPAERAEVQRRLLEFDSGLAIAMRRLGYTQVILECPELLTQLFLGHRANGLFARRGLRRITGHVIGLLLCKRFDFHRSRELGLYESTLAYLRDLAAHMRGRAHVVGRQFSAADLTLAAMLRGFLIVPCIAGHPDLQGLFAWAHATRLRCGGEAVSRYEQAIIDARRRRRPVRRQLREDGGALPFAAAGELASNDQRPIWDRGMWLMPWHYLVTLRRGTARQAVAADSVF